MTLSIQWVIFTIVFIFIIFLIYKVLKKIGQRNLYTVFGVSVTIFLSISMFIGMAIASINTIYSYLIGDSYDDVVLNANVSDESSSSSWIDPTFSHTQTVTMYQAVFEFTDKNGVKQTKESSIRSGEKPEIGEVRNITYVDGDGYVHENSNPSYVLDLICFYFAVMTGVTSIVIINYAFNRPVQLYVKLFVQLIILTVLLLVGEMWFLITSFMYEAMIGQREESLLAIMICLVFSLVLFLFLLSIFFALIKKILKR